MIKEPTRSLSEPGYGSALSSHKMRARAASGFGEQRSELGPTSLFATQPEDVLAPQPRHVVTIDDVVRGLGLDAVTRERILRLVASNNVQYSPRAGQQRLALGRGYLAEALPTMVPDVDLRSEIMRRALAFWRKTQSTDMTRSPQMRTVIKAEQFFAKHGKLLIKSQAVALAGRQDKARKAKRSLQNK